MFSTRAKEYVEALYASRSHVELTVGVLKDGLTQVKHFGPDGKEQEKNLFIRWALSAKQSPPLF